MSCLGVHFALTEKEAGYLPSLTDEQARLQHLQEVIEATYFEQHPDLKAESDKSWDAMHRALADGQMSWDGGDYPLNHTVLAGELLYTASDYIISLKTPQQVRDIAAALPAITPRLSFVGVTLPLMPRVTDFRCPSRISVTLGIGFRASETFTPERPKRDALFCLPPTNNIPIACD